MITRLFLFFLFYSLMILAGTLHAQNYQVKGRLSDTFTYGMPSHAIIRLLNKNDTIIKTETNDEGFFGFFVQNEGKYLFCVTHHSYLPLIDTLYITNKKEINLGTIQLSPKNTLLSEIVIQDKQVSRIYGDTTEFIVDSFQIRKFSTSFELISKIPGVAITSAGQLTYNGKPITMVNIDGNPFLSFDPNKLLNLLRGKDLDKVQFFDVKSKQSRLTGINDNSKEVGLNLTLKEAAKTGYYGKAAGGLGIEKSILWDNSMNVNSFNDSRRIMVFSETNNTASSSSIGEISLPSSSGSSQGKPQSFSAGIHYDSRILKDKKLSYNIDYLINKNIQNIINTSTAINILPGNEFITQTNSIAEDNLLTHNLNITLNYFLTASSSLNATISSNINSGNNKGENSSSSSGLNGSFLNNANSNISSTISSTNATANISYQKNFNKEGRTVNLSLITSLNKNNSDAHQISNSIYATNSREENISQQKENNQNNQNYIFNFQYTEPLIKNWRLSLNTSSNISKLLSDNNTYDIFKVDNLLRDTLNPLYSNHFISENIQNRVNVAMEYQKKRILLSFGGEISQLHWRQKDVSNNVSIARSYFNFLPNVSCRLNMNANTSLNLAYRSQTLQPQLNEIQPVANNYDPLHIVLGNPKLSQSYMHNVSLNFNNSKPFKNRYFNANATFTLVQNAISLKGYYNQDAKQVSQYYNINGNYNANFYTAYNLKLLKNTLLGFNESVFLSRMQNDLNNQHNIILSQQYKSSVHVTYSIDTLLSLSYIASFNYSRNNSSLVENSNNKLWAISQNLDLSYSLQHGFAIGNRFNWSLRTKTNNSDPNASIFLWNLSISKYLSKDEAVMLKLYAYDILNQNKNYQVYYGANIKSENASNTIGRYIMLGVIWNFTKRK